MRAIWGSEQESDRGGDLTHPGSRTPFSLFGTLHSLRDTGWTKPLEVAGVPGGAAGDRLVSKDADVLGPAQARKQEVDLFRLRAAGGRHPRLQPSCTTTLFRRVQHLDSKVIGKCHERHRSRAFIRFLDHLQRQTSNESRSVPSHGHLLYTQSAEVRVWLRAKRRNRFVSTSPRPAVRG